MKQSDLCEKFAIGATKGTASNMFIDNRKIYSYGTVIAQRAGARHVILNKTKYSSSTSRQQSRLHYELSRVYSQDQIIEVENIPMWALDLKVYL